MAKLIVEDCWVKCFLDFDLTKTKWSNSIEIIVKLIVLHRGHDCTRSFPL